MALAALSFGASFIIMSGGSDETVLDSSAGEYPYGEVNWYDGWVYFLKDDDVAGKTGRQGEAADHQQP